MLAIGCGITRLTLVTMWMPTWLGEGKLPALNPNVGVCASCSGTLRPSGTANLAPVARQGVGVTLSSVVCGFAVPPTLPTANGTTLLASRGV